MSNTSIARTARAAVANVAAIRTAALATIAGLAFSEYASRAETIAAFQSAVGSAPKAFDYAKPDKAGDFYKRLVAARKEAVIGRMAAMLPSNKTQAERIADAATIMALPASDAKQELKAGQTGRRTAAQDRAYGNAREYVRTLCADAGYSKAKTTGEKNARKPRVPTGGAPTPQVDNGVGIETAKAPKDKAGFAMHVSQQSASLLLYANKNAKIAPLALAEAIRAFHAAVMAAIPKD